MNTRILFHLIGFLLHLPLAGLGICCLVALFHDWLREEHANPPVAFGISFGFTLVLHLVLRRLGRGSDVVLRRRDSFVLVGLGWICCILCGTLPYCICEPRLGLTDAFFESVSGFTATGATVISGLDDLPASLLLWRAMTQWMGGVGVLILIVALLSKLGAGSRSLFRHESSTFDTKETRTTIQDLAKEILLIYAFLTTVCFLGLWLFCGMPPFHALCHTFTTVATGGFSTHDESVGYYKSLRIEIWIMIFMILSSINFLLYVWLGKSIGERLGDCRAWWASWRESEERGWSQCAEWWRDRLGQSRGRKGWLKRWKDDESFRYSMLLLVMVVLFVSIDLRWNGTSIPDSLRRAAFQATSIMTTTGYATADYDRWSAFPVLLLLVLMVVGGNAGSTSGGLKMGRFILYFKILRYHLRMSIRPKQVMQIKLNGNPVSEEFRIDTQFLIATAAVSLLLGTLAFCLMEPHRDLRTCFSGTLATLFNIGPALGDLGPTRTYGDLHAHTKFMLSFLMLLGRFEFYTFMVLFMPSLWKKH